MPNASKRAARRGDSLPRLTLLPSLEGEGDLEVSPHFGDPPPSTVLRVTLLRPSTAAPAAGADANPVGPAGIGASNRIASECRDCETHPLSPNCASNSLLHPRHQVRAQPPPGPQSTSVFEVWVSGAPAHTGSYTCPYPAPCCDLA